MAGLRALVSWENDPFPTATAFAGYISWYFSNLGDQVIHLNTSNAGKLVNFTRQLPSPPFVETNSQPLPELMAFLQERTEENWLLVCDWLSFSAIVDLLELQKDTFFVMVYADQTFPATKTDYENYCKEVQVEAYQKIVNPSPSPEKPSKFVSKTRDLIASAPKQEPDNYEPPLVPKEEAKSPDKTENTSVSSSKIEKSINESRKIVETQSKVMEEALFRRLNQIQVTEMQDPRLRGPEIPSQINHFLLTLMHEKEENVKNLCMETGRKIGENLQVVTRNVLKKEEEYLNRVKEIDQQALFLARRMQEIQGNYENVRNGGEIETQLAGLEAEIARLEESVRGIGSAPKRCPLRIIAACGRASDTEGPCPVLVIKWKDWTQGSFLPISLDAEGGIYPSKVILTEAVSVVPYVCQQAVPLMVTDGNSSLLLCKRDVTVYPAALYGSNDFMNWEINQQELLQKLNAS